MVAALCPEDKRSLTNIARVVFRYLDKDIRSSLASSARRYADPGFIFRSHTPVTVSSHCNHLLRRLKGHIYAFAAECKIYLGLVGRDIRARLSASGSQKTDYQTYK